MRRDDRGAVAVVMAIVMMSLLGVGALVLDAGSLYAERRQLQNGADAGVLAAAIDCPALPDCYESAAAQALLKANQNANDDRADVLDPDGGLGVCGRGSGLPECTPVSNFPAWPWDCRPLPSSGPLATADYVQVRTQTRTDDLETPSLMPPLLARVLAPGYDGSTVRACARASWGAPSSSTGQLPITISLCEYERYIAAGPPSYPPDPSREQTLYFAGTTNTTPCPSGPASSNLPGGFGWLDSDGEGCATSTSADGWAPGSESVTFVTTGCTGSELASYRGQIVRIPIFNEKRGTGNGAEYRIVGYAALYLTGYRFPAAPPAPSLFTGQMPCKAPDTCISGVFTEEMTATGGTVGTGTWMGVTVVQLSG